MNKIEQANNKMFMIILGLFAVASGSVLYLGARAAAPIPSGPVNPALAGTATLKVESLGKHGGDTFDLTGIQISGNGTPSCGGKTNYECSQNGNITTLLTAPATFKDGAITYNFEKWSGDCQNYTGGRSCQVTTGTGGRKSVKAGYKNPLSVEADQRTRVNYHRKNTHSRVELTNSGCLVTAARKWAKKMYDENRLSSPSQAWVRNNDGCSVTYSGMSINVGQGDTSEQIFTAFIGDTESHQNIDKAANRRIGAGAYTSSVSWHWVVQIFVSSVNQ